MEPGRASSWTSFGILAMAMCALCASVLFSGAAFADDHDEDDGIDEEVEADVDETAAWMPSFGISVGVHNQSISGDTSATSGDFPREDGDSLITEFFQFQGKLHTPLAVGRNDWLRVFLVAGFQIPLAEGLISERIDSDFDRGQAGFTDNCPDMVPTSETVTSCSLRVRNRVSIDAMWHAGFGLDFTLPLDMNQFHIQPALEYYGLAAQTVGEFRRTSASSAVNDFIEQSNTVGDPEIFHGISPSLTFLVDVYENGPWRWSMFLQGRAVFMLDEPDLEANTSLGANDVRFVSGMDDLIIQGAGGIQLQWTGTRRRR